MRRGFSLVDVIIALALIGLLMVTIFPIISMTAANTQRSKLLSLATDECVRISEALKVSTDNNELFFSTLSVGSKIQYFDDRLHDEFDCFVEGLYIKGELHVYNVIIQSSEVKGINVSLESSRIGR